MTKYNIFFAWQTLQIDPVTLHVRPAGTFYQSDSRNRSQFMRTPMTFPIVLPWTQPYRQEIIESTANIPISLLGPRSHGDGRCSSLDSISTENEMKSHEKYEQGQTATTAFVSNNDSTNDFDLDVDVIKYYKIADKKVVRFDLTPMNDEPIADFHDDSEKLQKSMSINSLDIIKFDTTPPLHSPEKFNYDVDDDLFSPKEMVTKSTADDDAIPFMFVSSHILTISRLLVELKLNLMTRMTKSIYCQAAFSTENMAVCSKLRTLTTL